MRNKKYQQIIKEMKEAHQQEREEHNAVLNAAQVNRTFET